MLNPIPFPKTLLGSLVAASIALMGCNTGTESQLAKGPESGGAVGTATMTVGARLPTQGDAQVAFIDPTTEAIEVRVFDFACTSWDDVHDSLVDFDPWEGDMTGCLADVIGQLPDWNNNYVANARLTGENRQAELMLAPASYLVVAASWDNLSLEGSPIAASASIVDLDEGSHSVELNMLTASWDIGSQMNFQVLNDAMGFDWDPDTEGTQSPAELLGFGSRLLGFEVARYRFLDDPPATPMIATSELDDFEDLLPLLRGAAQVMVYRTNRDGIPNRAWLEPGSGYSDAYEPHSVWWEIERYGGLLQDYSAERGNRAFVVLPEIEVEAWGGEQDGMAEHAFRDAGLFALSPIFWAEEFGSDLDGGAHVQQREVCLDASDPESCSERHVAQAWEWEHSGDVPEAWETKAQGRVLNGNTIETTFVEWQTKDWVTSQPVERPVPGFDGADPTAAAQSRGARSAQRQQQIAQAIARARFAQAMTGPAAASTMNCYDLNFQELEWYAQFLWDQDNATWVPGTLDWSQFPPVFRENEFRDPETGEFQEKFFAWEESDEIRACTHEVTLTARVLDPLFSFGESNR